MALQNKQRSLAVTVNALAIALLAVLIEQVLHEPTHALASVLVGARVTELNLFYAGHAWAAGANSEGDLVIAASAAIVNVLAGLLCLGLVRQAWARQRPNLRLFLMYSAAFNLFAGFGYPLVNALFYNPSAGTLGDWFYVIHVLGGTWAVRLPLLLVGVAGTLWGYFWLPRLALEFVPEAAVRAERVRTSLALLLIPYLVICALVSVLASFNPLGADVAVLTIIKYWFGFIPFFWAFFIAGYWLKLPASLPAPTPLPAALSLPWVAAAGLALVIALVVLLPSVRFG